MISVDPKDLVIGKEYAVRTTSSIERMVFIANHKIEPYALIDRNNGWGKQFYAHTDIVRTWEEHQKMTLEWKNLHPLFEQVLKDAGLEKGVKITPRPKSGETEVRLTEDAIIKLLEILYVDDDQSIDVLDQL